MENEESTSKERATLTIETVTCNRCHCTSTLPELFRKSRSKKYCPACAIKIEIRNVKILFIFVIIVFVFDLLFDGQRYGWFSLEAWSLPLIFLIEILSLMMHELSHAFVAKLLGGRVFGIQLGIGRQLYQRQFNDFYFSLHLLPASGLCFAGFPSNKALRLRYAFYISGGLIFHALIMFIIIQIFALTDSRPPLLRWIIIVNGLLLLFNILPRRLTTAAGQAGSDGMQLWRLLTGKLSQKELRRSYYRMAAIFSYQLKRNELTANYVREGLRLDPSDDVLENLRVFLLLNEENKLEEAYSEWKKMVESDEIETIPGLQQAVFYNNYAWTTLMHRPESSSLQIARNYAERAFQMAPWMPTIKGTLAAVLVDQGEYLKGTEWALSAAKEHEETLSPYKDESVASNLATAALGYFRMGKQEEADHYLKQAITLAPEERTVQKAITEIRDNNLTVEPKAFMV